MPRDLYQFPEVIVPFRLIVAPTYQVAQHFIRESGYYPRECRVITKREQLHGYDFHPMPGRPPNNGWEVWWLDRMWPCSTREDVAKMEELWWYLKHRLGADVRRWWT